MKREGPGPLVGVIGLVGLVGAALLFGWFPKWVALVSIALAVVFLVYDLACWIIARHAAWRLYHTDAMYHDASGQPRGFEVLPPKRDGKG
jgi:hypothetical protein